MTITDDLRAILQASRSLPYHARRADGSRVGREEGDVALSRLLTATVPVKVCCLVRADGRIDEWYAEWSVRGGNGYWHFDHESDVYAFGDTYGRPPHDPTPEQRAAIARLFFRREDPFGLGGGVGGPPQRWCRFGGADELEALGNEGQRGYYA